MQQVNLDDIKRDISTYIKRIESGEVDKNLLFLNIIKNTGNNNKMSIFFKLYG